LRGEIRCLGQRLLLENPDARRQFAEQSGGDGGGKAAG
jgi:hypothetical protein